MFTLHHGFWIYFLSRRHPQVWQFVFGSMLPDYVYFILLSIMVVRGQVHFAEVLQLSPTVMMSYLPMYPWAVQLDLIGHSVIIWGLFFGLSIIPELHIFRAVAIGWGTHLFIDALTHGAHANFYLYPLTMAAVHSPVSYWEPDYFAREFKIVNNGIMAAMAVYLLYHWWKYRKNIK